ncbi:MAG TPA: tRNA dihydrouridine synthase DusB, partial [Chitinophagales bacterium]|nr:tRNA dihydrouridine synthase DusB [Chitinophagales bacterium]
RMHLQRSVEWKGPRVGIFEMRRHYTNYFRGLPNVKEFREKLVRFETMEEIEAVFAEMLVRYNGLVEAKAVA